MACITATIGSLPDSFNFLFANVAPRLFRVVRGSRDKRPCDLDCEIEDCFCFRSQSRFTSRLNSVSIHAAAQIPGQMEFLVGTGASPALTPDGKSVTMTGRSAEVVRRQADGTWKFMIDNPRGGQDT